MPPRSKQPGRHSPKPKTSGSRAKSKSDPANRAGSSHKRSSRTKALALSQSVLRGPIQSPAFVNPLTIFEPLRRAMIDRQIELIGVFMAWSPPSIIAKQQAAFWEAFIGGAVPRQSGRTRSGKRRKQH